GGRPAREGNPPPAQRARAVWRLNGLRAHHPSPITRHEDHPIVVHVGTGRAGDDEIVEGAEVAVAVVVLEHLSGIELFLRAALQPVWSDGGPGIVLRAVYAVGVAGDGRYARPPAHAAPARQQHFPISPPPP